MRSFFIVALKLMGIYIIYLGISSIFQALIMMKAFSSANMPYDEILQNTLMYMYLSIPVSLLIGGYLLFYGEKIANILRIKDEKIDINSLTIKSAAQMCVSLIGIFIFIRNIGKFVQSVYVQIFMTKSFNQIATAFPKNIELTGNTIAYSIVIVFSLSIIIWSKSIVNYIVK